MSKTNKNSAHKSSEDSKSKLDETKKLQVHRAQVFKRAKKFIYPIGHSKRHILINSAAIVIFGIVALSAYIYIQIYINKSESNFVYRVSQLVPLSVGDVGGSAITYDEYLFELRSSKHFLETQGNVDFETTEGQRQLQDLRQLSMQKAVNNQVVENIAKANDITVQDAEVEEQISVLRSQASSFNLDAQFEEDDSNDRFIQILKQYYDWDEGDLKKVVKSQILQQKVMPLIDTETKDRAEKALKQLTDKNKKFIDLVELSDDEVSKENDGFIGQISDDQTIVSQSFDKKLSELENNNPVVLSSEYGFHVVEIRMQDGQRTVFNIFFAYREATEVLDEARQDVEIKLHDQYSELLIKSTS